MDSSPIRTDIRVDLAAFAEPLASKRFQDLHEAASWAGGAAEKLKAAFEPDVFRQLDKTMRLSIEWTVEARDYYRVCKVWSGSPGAAETSATRAVTKFVATALPAEIVAARRAAAAIEKRRVRTLIAVAVTGAAMCAVLFGVLRAMPTVFDREVQSGRILNAPPEPLGGAWARSIEGCERGRLVFARGKIEVISPIGTLSYPATFERLEAAAFKITFLAGGVRVARTVRIDPPGSSLVVQRIDAVEDAPRTLATLTAGARLVRCR